MQGNSGGDAGYRGWDAIGAIRDPWVWGQGDGSGDAGRPSHLGGTSSELTGLIISSGNIDP